MSPTSTRARPTARRGQPRLLWGRVGAMVLAAGLVFLAGRCSVDRGADPAELTAAQERVAQLEQENLNLREAQVAQAAGGIDTPPPAEEGQGDPAAGPADALEQGLEPGEEEPPAEVEQGGGEAPPDGQQPEEGERTYTVEAGDTLESIAAEVYGDGSRYTLIAEANDVDPTALEPGQELRIPPAPQD